MPYANPFCKRRKSPGNIFGRFAAKDGMDLAGAAGTPTAFSRMMMFSPPRKLRLVRLLNAIIILEKSLDCTNHHRSS
jgi:hypothetical protein